MGFFAVGSGASDAEGEFGVFQEILALIGKKNSVEQGVRNAGGVVLNVL